jgi:hypothetical protein|tara:strand:- start:602 stop:763 length:162 start_codon:yes stop_codon:yes gene_type:complete
MHFYRAKCCTPLKFGNQGFEKFIVAFTGKVFNHDGLVEVLGNGGNYSGLTLTP